jgi:hypothetical protein
MAKKAKPKRQKAQPSVLGSLPGQRPQRLGGRRGPATAPAAAEPETGARPRPRAAAQKPRKKAQPAPRPAVSTQETEPTAAAPAPPRRQAAAIPPPPAPPPTRRRGPPRGTELVTTAIQAAGELAQIGLTAGGQALKRAVDRIPRP